MDTNNLDINIGYFSTLNPLIAVSKMYSKLKEKFRKKERLEFPLNHLYYNNNDGSKPTKKGGYVRADTKVL
jgi:hypothetical protein